MVCLSVCTVLLCTVRVHVPDGGLRRLLQRRERLPQSRQVLQQASSTRHQLINDSVVISNIINSTVINSTTIIVTIHCIIVTAIIDLITDVGIVLSRPPLNPSCTCGTCSSPLPSSSLSPPCPQPPRTPRTSPPAPGCGGRRRSASRICNGVGGGGKQLSSINWDINR